MSYDTTAYEETYKDYTIKIKYDRLAENPFDDWDCEPPLAVLSDRYMTLYATQHGDVSDVPTLTKAQIKANISEILDILEMKTVWGLREHHQYDNIYDSINEMLQEWVYNANLSTTLEVLETLHNIAGVPALLKSIHGYAQGDYAEVLAVATKEFQDACGNEPGYWDDPEKLQPSIDLFRDWAFGNVYGYVIEDEKGEDVDSCWGYYGHYDNENGCLDEARAVVDRRVERDNRWVNRIKRFIRTYITGE